METYKDILDAIMLGKTVILTSRFGNTRTYFKNEKSHPRMKFNNCADSYFSGLPTTIDRVETVNIEVV